ncbi:MAG: hypothetical protein GX434_12880 [Peptococcaceae bacterium]|nr:hypothetical protein [Peptococcaceae bacterium]
MNYGNIAKLVHEAIKDPQTLLSEETNLLPKKVSYNEYSIIKNTLLKNQASGDVMAI